MPPEVGTVTIQAGLLIGRTVIGPSGDKVGHVVDLKAVQDGPLRDGSTATLRIDGLVIGHHGLGERLGLQRHLIHGPWLLKRLATIGRPCHYLPWQQIDHAHLVDDSHNPVRFTGELHPLTE